MLSDKCVHYEVPLAERNPDEWVILASGPNQLDWYDYAAKRKANIFCMNGSIMLCDNPTCYAATDPEAIKLFSYYIDRAEAGVTKRLGQEAITKLLGSYTIDDAVVRTMALWAIYIAIKVYKAKHVATFGVHGCNEKKQWPTVSRVSNEKGWKNIKEFREAFEQGPVDSVVLAVRHDISGPWQIDLNAACLIRKMRRMFPDVLIELFGEGPVVKLADQPEPLVWCKLKSCPQCEWRRDEEKPKE